MDNDKIKEMKEVIREIKEMRKREAKQTAKYCIKKLFKNKLGLEVNKISIDNGKHKYLNKKNGFTEEIYYEFITITFNNSYHKLVYLYSGITDSYIITLNNCVSAQFFDFDPDDYEYICSIKHIKDDNYIIKSDAGNIYKITYLDEVEIDCYEKIVDCFENETLCCIELIKLFKEYPILEYRRLSILILLSQRHNGDFKKLPKDIAILIAKKVYNFRY